MDNNGDGIGDFQGIISKLDYLKWLGVNAIWISPFYPSPLVDFGYDVTNYTDIHPDFGVMEDFDELLVKAHQQDIKVIMDFVPNHSSDQHPWFLDSRSSRHSAKRDWYIWKDPLSNGAPPNNWLGVFGGSSWEFDEKTGQYYFHTFLKEQPDFNWRNPEVQKAFEEIMRFWLDKGVDGFRVDAILHLIKDKHFRNNPPNPYYQLGDRPYDQFLSTFSADQPELHQIISNMRKLINTYSERVMIAEVYLPIGRLVSYYHQKNLGADIPTNFELIRLPWNATKIFAVINEYEGLLPEWAWPNWTLGNHDRSRIASRVGLEQAKVAAILLLTLRGTPTIYYGDEIGMTDGMIPIDQIRDPQQLRQKDALMAGREPMRTPMQWNNSLNAGFTTGTPILPIAHNYETINVLQQQKDQNSMLNFYYRLLTLRQQESALQIGEYIPVGITREIFAFIRRQNQNEFLIIINLSYTPGIFISNYPDLKGRVVLATHPKREGTIIKLQPQIELDGNEGLIVKLG